MRGRRRQTFHSHQPVQSARARRRCPRATAAAASLSAARFRGFWLFFVAVGLWILILRHSRASTVDETLFAEVLAVIFTLIKYASFDVDLVFLLLLFFASCLLLVSPRYSAHSRRRCDPSNGLAVWLTQDGRALGSSAPLVQLLPQEMVGRVGDSLSRFR